MQLQQDNGEAWQSVSSDDVPPVAFEEATPGELLLARLLKLSTNDGLLTAISLSSVALLSATNRSGLRAEHSKA